MTGTARDRAARRFANPGRRRQRLLLGLCVIALLTATAIVAGQAFATSCCGTARAKAVGQLGQGAKAGKRAPAFTVATVDRRVFSLAAQRGKVVVLDFLQAGCPSCAAEVSLLDRAARSFAGKKVKVLIIDLSGFGDQDLRNYYRGDLGASKKLLIAQDKGFRVARAFRLVSVPATFVIGPDGRIRWQGSLNGKTGLLATEIRKARA